MNLYLFRHGEAEFYGGSVKDADRALTPTGREDVLRQARDIFAGQNGVDTIFHSPYRRARQTAELLQSVIGVAMRIKEDLTPDGDAERVADSLLGAEGNVLWVTHLPLVGELAYLFTGRQVSFFQGSCAKVVRRDLFALPGELTWVRHPDGTA